MLGPVLALVAAAGFVALLSPCGFALLPAYAGFVLSSRIPHALWRSLATVAGFAVVLGVAWLVVGTIGSVLGRYFPSIALVVGVVLVVAGLVLVVRPARWSLAWARPTSTRGPYPSAFLFGVAFLIGSIGCTLPVFVAALAQTTTLGIGASLLAFIVFLSALSIPFVALTVLLALARNKWYRVLRRATPYIERVAALLLVAGGLIILWRTWPLL